MLGETLQRLRKRRGLSQEFVAARAGLSREYVSMVERDINSPTIDAFLRICRAMGARPSNVIRKIEYMRVRKRI